MKDIIGNSGFLISITLISFFTLSWYEFYEILYNSMGLYEERKIMDMNKIFWVVNIFSLIFYVTACIIGHIYGLKAEWSLITFLSLYPLYNLPNPILIGYYGTKLYSLMNRLYK